MAVAQIYRAGLVTVTNDRMHSGQIGKPGILEQPVACIGYTADAHIFTIDAKSGNPPEIGNKLPAVVISIQTACAPVH